MDSSYSKVMRIAKSKNGSVIWPISLNHSYDSSGFGLIFGEKAIEEFEVLFHVSGKASVSIGDKLYTPKRGGVFVFKNNEIHSNIITSTEPYERYILLFHHQALMDTWDNAKNTLLSMFFDRADFEHNYFELPAHETERVIQLMKRAVDYSDSTDPAAEGLFYSDVIKILCIINNNFHSDEPETFDSYSPIVNSALEAIEYQFSSLQTVEDLSKKLHVSYSYLTRVFKKQLGVSAYEYLQNIKLANAAKQLIQGHSVTEACFESGFNNYSYFIQVFKKKYGVTPLKFKKNIDI